MQVFAQTDILSDFMQWRVRHQTMSQSFLIFDDGTEGFGAKSLVLINLIV